MNVSSTIETAALILVAYLLGCGVGYVLHRLVHATQTQPKRPAVAVATEPVRRAPSPAARLAATVDEPPPPVQPRPVEIVEPKPPVPVEPVAPLLKEPEAPAKPRTPKPKPVDPKPKSLRAARNGKPDDLKSIKGIGPKIEASLHGLGVFHFDQIAAWSDLNVDWVDNHLAFKGRVRRERWIEQATAFAKGDA